MQRSLSFRESENEATRTVLVLWIIFEYFTCFHCFTNFLHRDAPYNALVGGMSRKLKLPILDFSADLIEMAHSVITALSSKIGKSTTNFEKDQFIFGLN